MGLILLYRVIDISMVLSKFLYLDMQYMAWPVLLHLGVFLQQAIGVCLQHILGW